MRVQVTVEAHDHEKIAYYAHAIKGSSGNLRFNELSENAKQMELAGKAADLAFDYRGSYNTIVEFFRIYKKY